MQNRDPKQVWVTFARGPWITQPVGSTKWPEAMDFVGIE